MLDRNYIRENPDEVRAALEQKGVTDVDFDRILELDEEWRDLKARGDDLRHERNEVSSKIGELKQEGKHDEADEAIERSQELKDEIEEIEDRAAELEETLEAEMLRLPQIPR